MNIINSSSPGLRMDSPQVDQNKWDDILPRDLQAIIYYLAFSTLKNISDLQNPSFDCEESLHTALCEKILFYKNLRFIFPSEVWVKNQAVFENAFLQSFIAFHQEQEKDYHDRWTFKIPDNPVFQIKLRR